MRYVCVCVCVCVCWVHRRHVYLAVFRVAERFVLLCQHGVWPNSHFLARYSARPPSDPLHPPCVLSVGRGSTCLATWHRWGSMCLATPSSRARRRSPSGASRSRSTPASVSSGAPCPSPREGVCVRYQVLVRWGGCSLSTGLDPAAHTFYWAGHSWQTGYGTARYWVLRLLLQHFAPGDSIFQTNTSSSPVTPTNPFCGYVVGPNYGSVTLTCADAGSTINSIQFTDWGTPSGSCGSFAVNPACTSQAKALAWVQAQCLRQTTCTLTPYPALGDPCFNVVKTFVVQVRSAEKVMSAIGDV